jgi:hypothetical protein
VLAESQLLEHPWLVEHILGSGYRPAEQLNRDVVLLPE